MDVHMYQPVGMHRSEDAANGQKNSRLKPLLQSTFPGTLSGNQNITYKKTHLRIVAEMGLVCRSFQLHVSQPPTPVGVATTSCAEH